jgi:FMN phosphatase YigB (HAD superfamily)
MVGGHNGGVNHDPRVAPTDTEARSTDSIDPRAIDAVVFDIGGVFAIRHPAPIRRGMSRAGFVVSDVDSDFHRAHYHAAHRLASVPMDGLHEHSPDFWVHFEHEYLRQIGIAADDLDAGVRAMREEVFAKETQPIWSYLLQENIAGFHRIAAVRPIAIVSNNDGTAVDQMLAFGVCQVGLGQLPTAAAIVDSTIVGVSKPDPRIFTPALDALGTDPARTLYVGDTVHADVRGSAAAGMPICHLDPYDLHQEFAHWRLPDLHSLADHLGAPALA